MVGPKDDMREAPCKAEKRKSESEMEKVICGLLERRATTTCLQ